jgi:dihydrolipoamide dehydrogenase
MSFSKRIEGMGLSHQDATLDLVAQRKRVVEIETHINGQVTTLLESQGVRLIRGTGRVKGPHEVVAETDDGIEEIVSDAIVVSTGSRPRIPDWAEPDGERVLTTRQAYPPSTMPEHLIVEGDADCQPPAGSAEQRPRGGGGLGGRASPAWGQIVQGRPGREC